MRTAHARQQSKAPLLTVIETLVERIGSIGDAFQARRGRRHVIGSRTQASNRIPISVRSCLIGTAIVHALLIALCAPKIAFGGAGIGAIDALLGEVAHGGFHRRPVFFLIRRQLQSGMNRCNLSIDERRAILRAHRRAVMETMLRIHSGRADDGDSCNRSNNGFFHMQTPCSIERTWHPRLEFQLNVLK
jgi:hypothetical protein